MTRHPTIPTDDAIHEAIAHAADEEAHFARELLASTAADHVRGVPIAQAEGITADTFDHDDHRAIWIALEVAADHQLDQLGAAKLCRRALREVGHWSDEGPLSATTSRWSNETLAALFESYPTGIVAVRPNAVRLLQARARLHAAGRALNAAWALLNDEEPPVAPLTIDRAAGREGRAA